MATAEAEAEVPRIAHEELSRRISDDSLLVVDVLAGESYRQGHLPGAISLPLADLPRLAAERLPDRDADIAVYCGSPT